MVQHPHNAGMELQSNHAHSLWDWSHPTSPVGDHPLHFIVSNEEGSSANPCDTSAQMNESLLLRRAKQVLEKNWTGSYTQPAPRLYPHQWNWDSGFHAIGYACFDQKKARTELLSLFKGQWKNGMLPHIVYHRPSQKYFPSAAAWKIAQSPDAPDSVLTSGITQPPLHATAAWYTYRNAAEKDDALQFLQVIFPKLISLHRFLYAFRDVEDTGLVANIHPWETGIDNSPKWDQILEDIKVDKAQTQLLKRKDLKFVSAEERPSDEAYLKFVYLMELFKRCRYDQGEITKQSPFLVYGVLFNSILFRANLDLLNIASLLGKDSKEIQSWIEKSKCGFEERLWDSQEGTYHSYDLRLRQPIRVRTASCALPLYGSIPDQDRAVQIKQHLYTVCPFHQEHLCVAVPTYNRTQRGFQASNYWRGPIWININWMICKGLLDYGFKELAGKIRLNIFRLVEQLGFWEYFYPLDRRGLGSEHFSWTAALVIDLLCEQTDPDPATQASAKK